MSARHVIRKYLDSVTEDASYNEQKAAMAVARGDVYLARLYVKDPNDKLWDLYNKSDEGPE